MDSQTSSPEQSPVGAPASKLRKRIEHLEQELRLARRQLAETPSRFSSEAQFRDLTGVGGWELYLATGKVYWSPEVRLVHEVPEDYDPNVTDGLQFYAPEARPVLQAALDRAIATGEGWNLDLPFITATGRHRWVRVVGAADKVGDQVVRLFGVFQDITDKREAAERARQNNEYLASIYQNADLAIFVVDVSPGGEFRYAGANPAQSRLAGLPEADFIGRTPDELPFIDVATADHLNARYRSCVEAGAMIEYEESIVIAGRRTWWMTRLSPIRDDDGRIWRLIGTSLPLTDRKLAQLALVESEARFKSLVDNLPGVVFRVRSDKGVGCRFEFISERARYLMGLEPEAVLENPAAFYAGLDPDDLQRLTSFQPFEAKMGQRLEWTSRRRVRNEERWFRYQAEPRQSDEGGVIWDGVIFDITEGKLAALERERYEARFRAGFNSSFQFTFLTSLSGQVIEVNDAALAVMSIDREQAAEMAVWQLPCWSTTETVTRSLVARAVKEAAQGQAQRQECTMRDAGGRALWVDLSVKPCRNAEGQVEFLIVECRDLTLFKEGENRRRALESSLQNAQRLESMGVLAGGIAHDFNNLLAGILGYCELAQHELAPEAPSRSYVRLAIESTQRAADLTRQLLAYSGKGRFEVEDINLTRLVQEVTHLVQTIISKRAVIRFDLVESLPLIHADKTQVRQVLVNLIVNASEAIGDRSGLISIRTGVMHATTDYLKGTYIDENLPEGYYTYIEVTDTGCGITPETLSRIFDPFFTTKDKGHGLGLAATLGIIRSHHAFVKVYSEVNKGTTFKVGFPSVGSVQVLDQEQNPTRREPSDWQGQVLVVDDEETVRTVTRMLLERMGFSVTTADDGRQALGIFRPRAEEFLFVLMDLTMPHLSGEETFRQLRSIRRDLPVILMSGFTEEEAISSFVGKGLAAFVQKPFRMQELRAAIKKSLANALPGE